LGAASTVHAALSELAAVRLVFAREALPPGPAYRGKLGATKAITMRRLKVQGPFLQLLKGGDRVLLWVDTLRTIPTEFEGEYAQYNITGKQRP
jgi:hypothetical protein